MRLVLPSILTLTLLAPAWAAPEVAPPPREIVTHRVPYKLTDTQHVMVRIKLNGKGPYNFILDTGAPALIMTEAVAKEAGADIGDKGWGEFDLKIEGGVHLPKAKGIAHDMFQLKGMNAMGFAGVELHGVLGYNILARYRIAYDFTSDRLLWTPLAFTPPPIISIGGKGGDGGLEMLGNLMKFLAPLMGMTPNFERKPRGLFGVEFSTAKEPTLTAVLPGGPAGKAGFLAGDVITAVKGKAVATVEEFHTALGKLGEGEKITLTVRQKDGTTVERSLMLGRGF